MKRLMVLCLSAACLWAGISRAQVASTTEEDRIADQAVNALWWGDFDELERQHALYQQPGQRTAAGRSKLVHFRDGLHRILKGPAGASDAYFTQMDALTLQWVQANPTSALAPVLHASALTQHAWFYRGEGLAKSVPPDAWRDFERYVAKAIDYLAANQAVAMRSSSGHQQLLALGLAASWQQPAMWSVTQAGLAVNADDEGLYRAMLNAVLPKWGGSAAQVDRVIGEIAKATAPAHGDIFYSRMYAWASDWEFEQRLFLDTGVSWPRMKAGYQQWLERYPAAINFNAVASFACMARDKPMLLDLLERVGPTPILDSWGRNGNRTYIACKRWASEQ